MGIAQRFAVLNRKTIVDRICHTMNLHIEESFETIHNYIDLQHMILRKGAVSARDGEKLIIPINMAYGSFICVGKGNDDWNQSAPHGAGRLMSRKDAKETFSMDEFKTKMIDVYSTTVCEGTIDEAPMAYKPANSILENIKDTVDVINIIKPIYNFKAS